MYNLYNLSVCRRTTHSFSAVLVSLSAVCLFAPGTASAVDFDVQPRLNTGVMYYEFTQDASFTFDGQTLPGFASGETTVSDSMPFVGGGATLFVSRFFVDVYAQKAFSGNDDATLGDITFLDGGAGALGFQQFESDWDREEYAVSLGYAVTDNFALYAGYRLSDTEFEEQGTVAFFDNATGAPLEPGSIDRTLDYEQDGPFVGGNYRWRIADAGSLALNLGIAFIDGELTVTSPVTSAVGTGDTVGTTVGLSWTAPLPVLENFNYTVGVDGYQYSFEGDENFNDFSETVIRGSAGVSYLF